MQADGEAISRHVKQESLSPLKAYRAAVFDDVLAPFALKNLEYKASEAANEEFGAWWKAAQHITDLDGAGEAARERGRAAFETLYLVRQAMFNLLAAGLYHLVEQRLADVCRYGADGVPPPRDTKLSVVTEWFKKHFRLMLKSLPSWSKVDELRLVANVVKHGEGGSERELRVRRPVLFQNPEKLAFWEGTLEGDDFSSGSVHTPLAGVDLYVTEDLLKEYFDAAELFFKEVARHFEASGQTG